jgi:hypothetical protein
VKTLRLLLAAAAVAAVVAPATAQAGNGCTIYWTTEKVGPVEYREPHCAW